MAVSSSTRARLSGKNGANHRDGHAGGGGVGEKEKSKPQQRPLTASHYQMSRSNLHKYTVTGTMHGQNTVTDAAQEPN